MNFSFQNIVESIARKFNIFALANECASRYPVYWAIEESEDAVVCCLVVRFYNAQNELIHQQNLPAQSREKIDEQLFKQIRGIKHKIIRDQVC